MIIRRLKPAATIIGNDNKMEVMMKRLRNNITVLLSLILVSLSGCVTTSRSNKTLSPVDETTVLDKEADKIAQELSKQLPKDSRVLVLDFRDLNGIITHFGRYMAEKINITLSNFQGLTVVERQNIKLVLEEQKLQISGAVDEKTAVRIGKLVGANNIVYGTVTELENSIALNLRIVDVEKAVVTGGVSHNISKTREVVSLVGTIIKTEEEIMRELESKRQTILQEIEAEKQQRFKAIEEEEREKKYELAKLEKEIREKSIIIAEYEKKKKELERKNTYIDRIHREIDALNLSVLDKLKLGMTLRQVKSVLGSNNVHYADSRGSGDWYTAGRYFLYFEGRVLVKVVRGGHQGKTGRIVDSVIDAIGAINIGRY